MRHRVFIAINLPEEIKRKLKEYEKKWPELPAQWVKKESLHITLVFLGYLNDQELVEVCKIAREIASKHEPFSMKLKKICYGPPGKGVPRMVWLIGEKSEVLAKLKSDLEESLLEKVSFAVENRGFSPHITLARIKQWEWRKIEPEERPGIEEELDLTFEVSSIEVMESQLKREGAEYAVLESAPLG